MDPRPLGQLPRPRADITAGEMAYRPYLSPDYNKGRGLKQQGENDSMIVAENSRD